MIKEEVFYDIAWVTSKQDIVRLQSSIEDILKDKG